MGCRIDARVFQNGSGVESGATSIGLVRALVGPGAGERWAPMRLDIHDMFTFHAEHVQSSFSHGLLFSLPSYWSILLNLSISSPDGKSQST